MTQHGTYCCTRGKRSSNNNSIGVVSSSESYDIECHCVVDSASQMSTTEYVIECDCKPAFNDSQSRGYDGRSRSPNRKSSGRRTEDLTSCQCADRRTKSPPKKDDKKYKDITKIVHKKCKILSKINNQIRAAETLFRSKDYKCCPRIWTIIKKKIGKYPAYGLIALLLLLLVWGLLAHGAKKGARECGKSCMDHKAAIY